VKRLLLLLILLLPFVTGAQEVKPGLSRAYLDLIRKDSLSKTIIRADTTNSMRNSFYDNKTTYDGRSPVAKIKFNHNTLAIKPAKRKTLFIGTTFTSSIEMRTANKRPALQNEYVQGRSQSGQLVWRGPETNEQFSYGPAIRTLEFDHSNYPYDVNGKLVSAGTGSGQQAIAYNNDILRTGSLLLQSLHIQAKYRINEVPRAIMVLKIGDKQENLLLKNNRNNNRNLSASIELPLRPAVIKIGYTSLRDRYTHSNRNGFLNRIYQQSLLTPVSFENAQGTKIGTAQRSHSAYADNPYFLLDTDENSFRLSHQTGSLSIEKKIGRVKVKVQQSIEDVQQNSNETYQPGTAYFPTGIAVKREKNDRNYLLKANLGTDISYGGGDLRSTMDIAYLYGNNRSGIRYTPGKDYRYQRSYHDIMVNYFTNLVKRNVEAGLFLSNKMYASNSSNKKDFFLPGITGFGKFYDPFNLENVRVKVLTAFSNFNSELPIDRSFSVNNLLQYSVAQSMHYFPLTEVETFNNLSPIRHTEWNARVEIDYDYKIYFEADYFIRNTRNDVFAIYRSGNLQLENLADHRNQGFEISLNINSRLWNARKVTTYSSLSLFRNRSTVTDVKGGYNHIPIAGFSDINKSVVKGQPLGVITGTRYKRDASNHIMIGTDGFPMVDPTPGVIGNPIADFVLKLNNTAHWKYFTLNFDIEWKKGGDMWNGTQAVLDYYGRSANTALLRNTTNYVFDGVLENGHVNTYPVNFYDASQAVENNRWTRYGLSGVGEEYIRKADHLRLNTLALSYRLKTKKFLQQATFTLSVNNLILWTPYDGADPNQFLFDQQQTTGLDFFNLPSTKNYGFSVSFQF
jgi:hypothetical protein